MTVMMKRGRPKNFWTEAREQKLRDMNARGCTDGEIAKAFGCSRNKIIGKRSRLGLAAINAKGTLTLAQRKAIRNERARQRRQLLRIVKPKVVKALPPKEPKPIGPLNDIPANGCRWIHGAPGEGDWRMCGTEKAEGVSYCAHHLARTVAPTPGLTVQRRLNEVAA